MTTLIDKKIAVENESASVEDIKHAIDLTSEEESPEEEKEILKGLVTFGNTAAKAIMTPRVEVKAIDMESTFDEVIGLVNEYNFSRIPVYEETLDSLKGVLYIKDLLPLLKKGATNKNWHELIREAYYVPESKKIDDLLDEFKDRRLHIAAVVDEFGGLSGIVTLEDIVEEIFGEINDEFDGDELVYSKLSDSEFVFDGMTPLNDLLKITDLATASFDEIRGDSDSLAGLILEIHGKIPEAGEVITHENFEFHVESVGDNRIKRVKFVIQEKTEEIAT